MQYSASFDRNESRKVTRSAVALFIVILLSCSANVLAATLSHEKISKANIRITLENDAPMEIDQAQAAIGSYAVQVCEGKYPLFGKYTFNSTENVASASADEKESLPSSFSFIQEIECVEAPPEKPEGRRIDISKEQEESIKIKVANLTIDYLLAKESGRFREAYDSLGSEMKDITGYTAWEKRESTYFTEKLGGLISRDIWNTTVYNNPPNAPKPGIYIAIDYENKYELAPIHCGFIVWYMPTLDLSEISIMREEYGRISKRETQNSTPELLKKMRAEMKCRAL